MASSEAAPNPTAKSERPRVLVSDDQHDILTALSLLLKLNQYSVTLVDSPPEALRAVRESSFDLILMDLNYTRDTTSGQEGLELLATCRKRGFTAPIVVMTAWGNVELAVEAMRLGANDFIQKPWDNQRLLATVMQQLERAKSERNQKADLRSELEIARHVQQNLFPHNPKLLHRLEYAGICIPAKEVGGDYYDFIELGPTRIAGVLADVSGKGIAAAMLMANLQACIRTQLDSGGRHAIDILETVNRLFYASSPPEQYATLFYFEYDDATGDLHYVNCGHLAPILLRAGGEAERLSSTNTVIGLFPHCPCEARSVTLRAGDTLVLFSDGVIEFNDSAGEEFGEERFLNVVSSAQHLNVEAALRHITSRLTCARSNQEQSDDQTVVLLKRR